jgi:hypothetical protein
MRGCLESNEEERRWNEAVVAKFKISSGYLGGLKENYEKNCNSRPQSQHPNLGPPDYEAAVPNTRLRRTVGKREVLTLKT